MDPAEWAEHRKYQLGSAAHRRTPTTPHGTFTWAHQLWGPGEFISEPGHTCQESQDKKRLVFIGFPCTLQSPGLYPHPPGSQQTACDEGCKMWPGLWLPKVAASWEVSPPLLECGAGATAWKTARRAFVLHVTDPSSIPSISDGP